MIYQSDKNKPPVVSAKAIAERIEPCGLKVFVFSPWFDTFLLRKNTHHRRNPYHFVKDVGNA